MNEPVNRVLIKETTDFLQLENLPLIETRAEGEVIGLLMSLKHISNVAQLRLNLK